MEDPPGNNAGRKVNADDKCAAIVAADASIGGQGDAPPKVPADDKDNCTTKPIVPNSRGLESGGAKMPELSVTEGLEANNNTGLETEQTQNLPTKEDRMKLSDAPGDGQGNVLKHNFHKSWVKLLAERLCRATLAQVDVG